MVEFPGVAKQLETLIVTLVVTIVVDTRQLNAGYSEVTKASEAVSDTLKNVQKTGDETTKVLDKVGDAAQKSAENLDVIAGNAVEAGTSLKQAASDVNKMEQSLKKEGDAAQEAGDETEKAGDAAKEAGDKISKGTKSFDIFAASLNTLKNWAFTAAEAIIAVSTAAVNASDSVKEATNIIKLGTGKSGEDLTGLMDEFNKIAGTVPNTMEDVSIAIADLSNIYQVQGGELEGLARQYLALATITKGDVSKQIGKAESVFSTFGVTVGEQADTLDYFYQTARLSGVEFDDLLEMLDAGDEKFQALGMNAKEAAAFVGTLIKTNGMQAADELTSGLQQRSDQGKAVQQVTNAVQSGALAWQDFDAEVSASTKSIQDWEKETRTTGDAIDMLGTRATLAIAPVGDSIGAVLTEKIIPALDELGPYFEGVIPAAIRVVEMFGEGFEESMKRIKPILDALKPILDAFFGAIGSGSSSSLVQLNPVIRAMELFGDWWDKNSDTIIAGCGVIWEKLQEFWTLVEPYVVTIMDVLGTLIDAGIGTILDLITITFALISGDTEKVNETLLTMTLGLMKSLGMLIENGLNAVLEFVETSLKGLLRFVADIAKGIVSIFQNAANAVIDAINMIIDGYNYVAETTGAPKLSHLGRVNIVDNIENLASGIIDRVALPRVTMFSDKISELEAMYEKLLADQRAAMGETVTDYSVTNYVTQNIYANDMDTGKTIGDTAGTKIVRYADGGGGRG